jgi:hypothetical protein
MTARIFIFLVVASAAFAQLIPSSRIAPNYTPGTYTGVPGGIVTTRTNIVNVMDYGAAGVETETTGTITSGSTSLVVADPTSFAVGNYIRVGTKQVVDVTILTGATSTGTITVSYGVNTVTEVNYNWAVSVVSGDTAAQVAEKIRAATGLVRWTMSGTGATIRFTCSQALPITTGFSVSGRGVTASASIITTGSTAVSSAKITVVAGDTLTLDTAATASATDGIVSHNDTAAINAAINASSAQDIIYIPAGTYPLWTQVLAPAHRSNRTIRGAGNETILRLNASAALSIGTTDSANNPAVLATIAAGATSLDQGSTILDVGDSSLFPVNRMAKLTRTNDISDAIGVSSKQLGKQSQHFMVVGAPSATEIEIFPGLYGDYRSTSATLGIYTNLIQYFGIEDLHVDAFGSEASTPVVRFFQTRACWIKGVRVSSPRNRGFSFGKSLQFEFRENYLNKIRNVGNNGYGAEVSESSGGLVEDNIFYDAFPHIQVNDGVGGTVFGYNFFELNYSGGLMSASINANHGAHNAFNLYEGNISSKFQPDGYWGGSSDDTVFGNWFHATNYAESNPSRSSDQFGIGIVLNRFSYRYNVVGNILGRAGEVGQRYINVGPSVGYEDTSATSHTIGTGVKAFTVSAGKGFADGVNVKIMSAADNDNYMIGGSVAYSGTTLTVTVSRAEGSGTHSDWVIRAARGTGYSDRFMISLGLPNIGNGSYAGMSEMSKGLTHAWANWPAFLLGGTSASTHTIGTGSKVFTVAADLFRPVGMAVLFSSASSPSTRTMRGAVTAYSGTDMTVNVTSTAGSGEYSDWTFTGVTDANSYPEYDWDVWNTVLIKGNYNYATESIPSAEALGGDTLPVSLYTTTAGLLARGVAMGSRTLPLFNALSPGTPAFTDLPAGARYLELAPDPDPEPPSGATATIQTLNVSGTLNIATP